MQHQLEKCHCGENPVPRTSFYLTQGFGHYVHCPNCGRTTAARLSEVYAVRDWNTAIREGKATISPRKNIFHPPMLVVDGDLRGVSI
jgi:hypothetical protein